MSWIVFVFMAYLALALEMGLSGAISIGRVTPSFVLILGVYLGMRGPRPIVPWVMLILGLGLDLLPGPGREGIIFGPSALGYLAGAYAVLTLRALVLSESVIALAVLTFVTGLFVEGTEVLLLQLRGLPWLTGEPIVGWSLPDQLTHRFLDLLYTTAAALPLGWLLLRSTPLWGFSQKPRHGKGP